MQSIYFRCRMDSRPLRIEYETMEMGDALDKEKYAKKRATMHSSLECGRCVQPSGPVRFMMRFRIGVSGFFPAALAAVVVVVVVIFLLSLFYPHALDASEANNSPTESATDEYIKWILVDLFMDGKS